MFRSGSLRASGWIAVVLVASAAGIVHGQKSAGPAVDAVAMEALLAAPSGSWTVTKGQLAPLDNDRAALFVQADAYRRSAEGVVVPLAIGLTAAEPWSLVVRISGAGGDGMPEGQPAAEVTLGGGAGVVRETREVVVRPGTYTLTGVLARRGDGRATLATVVRGAVIVPSLAAATLEATPLVIGDAVSTAREVEPARPFVFGPTVLTPAATNRFHQADKLHLALRVHGWKDGPDARPDVSVEYVFRQVLDGKPRFFNKTKPQDLNAKTLAKSFDGSPGLVAAGISLPLDAFPPGEFEVLARVKDKRTQSTAVQAARFIVTP